jgi:hypothetical protein
MRRITTWGLSHRVTEVAPIAFLEVRRIVCSAPRSENCEIVDLAFLGMHQHHTAFPTSEVDRMIACVENGRGADKALTSRSRNRFQTDLKVCGQEIVLNGRDRTPNHPTHCAVIADSNNTESRKFPAAQAGPDKAGGSDRGSAAPARRRNSVVEAALVRRVCNIEQIPSGSREQNDRS